MKLLRQKFTPEDLAELKEIFYIKRKYIDREKEGTMVSCDPLEHSIKTNSNNPEITMEALQFLGIVDHVGFPYLWYIENGYFCLGPQEGARYKPSWTGDEDVYTTRAGFELVKYVAEIFDFKTAYHLQTYKLRR
jgi:hypothetical protein